MFPNKKKKKDKESKRETIKLSLYKMDNRKARFN